MKTMFRKMALSTALAATAMSALAATPATAQGWNGGGYRGGRGGDGVGIAIAAGVLGLAVGAALADHSHRRAPVTYAPPADWYDGYPVEDYYQMGWSWRNGSWWDRDGQRFSRPFMGRGGFEGGPRGGYQGGEPGRGDGAGGFGGGRGPDGGAGGWNGGDHGPGGPGYGGHR